MSNTSLDAVRVAIDKQLGAANAMRGLNPLQLGGKFAEIIKEVLSNFDLNGVSKEEVLKLVGDAYDTYIAPIDIPYVPESIEAMVVDPALKSMSLRIVGNFIDARQKS